jgi:NAD(P)-dependent dehydrogenase (short-subunit alcohol dehydrogenase family)
VPAAVAVVTGANRGIGMAVCRDLAARGFAVLLGSRDLRKGEAAARALNDAAGTVPVRAVALDVTDPEAIARLAAELDRVDVLVNNAAILYDTGNRAATVDLDIVRSAMETNLFGAWAMAQALLPQLRRSDHGRIVNVSSEAGSLASMRSGAPAYQITKAALNAFTRTLAGELQGTGILVNAVCPGWVETDMGGPGGRPVAEGAASVVWAALLPDAGPTGGFFRDGQPVPF